MSKNNLQEPQRNRNVTANFVHLIRTSTVAKYAEHYQRIPEPRYYNGYPC